MEVETKLAVYPTASSLLLMEKLCNHWILNVLLTLGNAKEKPMKYGEIKKSVHSKSDKMLDTSLKELDAYGLIKKHYHFISPKHYTTDYCLTDQGRLFLNSITPLNNWINENFESIQSNLAAYNQERLAIASLDN